MIARHLFDMVYTPEMLSDFLKQKAIDGAMADKAALASIAALSHHNFKRLQKILFDLEDMGLLSIETLLLALQRVTHKIPSFPVSTVTKIKLLPRHEITVDGKFSFFSNHGASRKTEANGGIATINKAYASADATDPAYMVKRIYQQESVFVLPWEVLTRREAKYLRFMERDSHWYFSKKGPVIVSNWLQGLDLVDTTEELKDFSYQRRLQWLMSGLNDVEKLHVNFRLHGDIKPDNFVLDINNDKLQLIDLASVQKVNSDKYFPFTTDFSDYENVRPRKLGSDMLSMGYVLASLFPDLFLFKEKIGEILVYERGIGLVRDQGIVPPLLVVPVEKSNFTNTELAVKALLNAMMEPVCEHRCTSQQAILFCSKLTAMLTVQNDIDDDYLNTLLATTINRNVYEVEDALRGCMRPAKFGAVKHVKQPPASTAPTHKIFAPVKKDKVESATAKSSHRSGCVIS